MTTTTAVATKQQTILEEQAANNLAHIGAYEDDLEMARRRPGYAFVPPPMQMPDFFILVPQDEARYAKPPFFRTMPGQVIAAALWTAAFLFFIALVLLFVEVQ